MPIPIVTEETITEFNKVIEEANTTDNPLRAFGEIMQPMILHNPALFLFVQGIAASIQTSADAIAPLVAVWELIRRQIEKDEIKKEMEDD